MTAQPKVFEAQSTTVPCGVARRWPAVWSVMAGIFVIVTAEILPIGLLLPISAEFAVSPGTSGLMMTVPGLVAAIAAPLATVATARVDRRLMLSVWLVVLAASNLVSAVASEFWMVLAARVLVGIVIGGFWSIGAGLACRLVDERSVARATSTIFLAVPLGSVLGVPIGTFIADVAGWRTAFVCLGVATLVVVAALVATLPALPPEQVTRLAVLGALLARRQVRIGLLLTFTIVVAHFGTYTYVSAFLEEVTRVDLGTISVLLLVYGAAGLVGNLIAGVTIAKNLRATFAAAACLIAIATVALPFAGTGVAAVVGLLILWGVAYGAVPACSQSWLARASGGADEAATVLFTSSFQATISIAALLGGFVVDGASLTTVMLLGGATAAVTVFLVVVAGNLTKLDA
jgi:predicted MFS family arabinose efflux permease